MLDDIAQAQDDSISIESGGRMSGRKPIKRCRGERDGRAVVALCLLAGSISCWAGYIVDSHVETSSGANRYTWTVYNQDQSWGLDGFTIEVPVQTRILAHTVPPPYSNPNGIAYWILQERNEAWVDPHDNKVTVPAPPPGMKVLFWWGQESTSVYPPGTSVTFSVTTDSSVGPGVVRGSAVTYTPQNSPHYYVPWQGEILGPSTGLADAASSSLPEGDPRTQLPDVRSVLVTNLVSRAQDGERTLVTALPAASITMHAAVTIDGVVGVEYGIQYSTALTDPNGWHGLANVILTTPKQVWYDPQPAFSPQRYYRIVRGSISIP